MLPGGVLLNSLADNRLAILAEALEDAGCSDPDWFLAGRRARWAYSQ
jgi:hypothetical protein